MLVIHGRATSSNVQAVMWAVQELGLAHRRLDVGGAFGGTETLAFRAMNPMGRVPVIEDGDVILFESQAILRYLADKHKATHLWPTDPTDRAAVDQWMEWAKSTFYQSFTYKIFWQLVRTIAKDRDHDLVATGTAELKDLMTIAARQIQKQGWLAADHMTLADISFGTHLYRYFNVTFDRNELPELDEYYQRLTARPAYAEHAMVSFDALRVDGA